MTETVNDDNTMRIEHQGSLTALEIPVLKEKLLQHLNASTGVTLVLSDVGECDSLGVQLLCSTGKTAKTSGKRFVMAGDFGVVLDMANRMGLAQEDCFTLEKKEI